MITVYSSWTIVGTSISLFLLLSKRRCKKRAHQQIVLGGLPCELHGLVEKVSSQWLSDQLFHLKKVTLRKYRVSQKTKCLFFF